MQEIWHVESKSDVHFRRPKAENLDNPEKNTIFRITGGFQIGWWKWTHGFRFYMSKKYISSIWQIYVIP